MPAVQSLAADLRTLPGRWRVTLRDQKGGIVMPVIVPEAVSAHVAISAAMNRAARFAPGRDWKPVCAFRVK